MLKVKKSENKNASPTKPGKAKADKTKKVAKKPPQSKQIKDKKDVKKVKKVVKGGLVKAPPAGSPKVGSPKVKKVIDAEKLEALRLKRKQKKLEKKLKKAASKKKPAEENGKEAVESEAETKDEQNDSTAESESKPAAKAKPSKKVQVKSTEKEDSDSEDDTKKEPKHAPIKPKQTVFIGNLPTNTKRIQLVKLFNKFGTILCVRFRTASGKVIFKHKARKESNSLNGYVVFDNEESATKALEMNNFEFKGNHIRVTPSEVEDQQRDPKRTVVVGNLKYTATDEKLHQIFSSCGEIEYVRTIQNGDKGCNGVAFVCFKAPDAVGLALELKGTVLDDRPINVEQFKANKAGAKFKRDKDGAAHPGWPKKQPNSKKGGKRPNGPGKPNKYKFVRKEGGEAANGDGPKASANGKKAGGNPKKPTGPPKRNPGKKAGDGIKKQKGPGAGKDAAAPTAGGDHKKTKPEFRGVKSTIVKKKQKKVPSAMKKLAKKIAPKGDD